MREHRPTSMLNISRPKLELIHNRANHTETEGWIICPCDTSKGVRTLKTTSEYIQCEGCGRCLLETIAKL